LLISSGDIAAKIILRLSLVVNKRIQNSTASCEFVIVKSSVYKRQFLFSGVIIAKNATSIE